MLKLTVCVRACVYVYVSVYVRVCVHAYMWGGEEGWS